MRRFKMLDFDEIKPGALVVNRYSPEIGIVLDVDWCMVHYLVESGKIEKMLVEDFQICYEVQR